MDGMGQEDHERSGEEPTAFPTFESKRETYPFTVLARHRGWRWESVVKRSEDGTWLWVTRAVDAETLDTKDIPGSRVFERVEFGGRYQEPLEFQLLEYLVAQIDTYMDRWSDLDSSQQSVSK
jgi:hypothetical protein